MHECKGAKTSMPTNGHLGTDENGKDFDQQVYRSMIVSLIVSMCIQARYNAQCLHVCTFSSKTEGITP